MNINMQRASRNMRRSGAPANPQKASESGSAEAVPDRASHLCHGLAAAMDPKLLQNVLDVILGGAGLDVQPIGDFLVGEAAIHQLDNLKFAVREGHFALGAQR